jgi:phospholipase/carboxylesterase
MTDTTARSQVVRFFKVGWLVLAVALVAHGCITSPQQPAPGSLVSRVMTYDGLSYPFVVYVPSSYDPRIAAPAVLLVHGAGGDGPDFVGTWTTLAESKGIILVAPTLDLSADAETKVPVVFPRLMDAAASEWNVDPARRYLFGYSAGGYFVYDAALLNANYFAGAGVFGSVIQPEYDSIVADAQRTTSIAIYLGDHDPYFSFAEGRRTRDLLLGHGMDVHYVELANQDHDYAAVAVKVNADFWRYITSRPER